LGSKDGLDRPASLGRDTSEELKLLELEMELRDWEVLENELKRKKKVYVKRDTLEITTRIDEITRLNQLEIRSKEEELLLVELEGKEEDRKQKSKASHKRAKLEITTRIDEITRLNQLEIRSKEEELLLVELEGKERDRKKKKAASNKRAKLKITTRIDEITRLNQLEIRSKEEELLLVELEGKEEARKTKSQRKRKERRKLNKLVARLVTSTTKLDLVPLPSPESLVSDVSLDPTGSPGSIAKFLSMNCRGFDVIKEYLAPGISPGIPRYGIDGVSEVPVTIHEDFVI
jgi:hypothetical protein